MEKMESVLGYMAPVRGGRLRVFAGVILISWSLLNVLIGFGLGLFGIGIFVMDEHAYDRVRGFAMIGTGIFELLFWAMAMAVGVNILRRLEGAIRDAWFFTRIGEVGCRALFFLWVGLLGWLEAYWTSERLLVRWGVYSIGMMLIPVAVTCTRWMLGRLKDSPA